MRFVRTQTLAGELRGAHIAGKLGVPISTSLEDAASGEWVVFVKTFDGMKEAKAAGCYVACDPVDFFCYGNREIKTDLSAVDLVIIPNKKAAIFYKNLFSSADFLVIPHQWDQRIVGLAEHDTFRPGYIGRKFNFIEVLNIPTVFNEEDHIISMPKFNCHVADRSRDTHRLLKPATKVAAAASVLANIVTHKDESALELLGEDYPFYATTTLFDALFRTKKAFGTQVWLDGIEKMKEVRDRTSLDAVSDLYKVLM